MADRAALRPLTQDDPRTVGGYVLRARLGAGGMGRVYLSTTPGGRPVALKVIRDEFAEDPEFRRRFRQEVDAAQRVHGAYTAPVLDADPEGPRPWLATTYVAGPSLNEAVHRHGALPADTVLVLTAGIAEALQSIHKAGVVHRDLKPSNVLLAADGPRVIDFGIARAAAATSLTGSNVVIGTPAYMAPEQALGRTAGPATDVFALGALAVYAATGTGPFGDGSDTSILYRVVHEEPDLAAVPEPLRQVIVQLLAKEPGERPDPEHVIELCRNASADSRLSIAEGWLPDTLTAEIDNRKNERMPPVPSDPRKRRRLALAGAFTTLALLAVGGVTYGLAKDGGKGNGGAAQGTGGPLSASVGPTHLGLPTSSPSPSASAATAAPQTSRPAPPAPQPIVYDRIDLPEGRGLDLSDDPLRPKTDRFADIVYKPESYRPDADGFVNLETGWDSYLVLLDGNTPGSLDECRTNTQEASSIPRARLVKNAQVCMITKPGHIGLIEILGYAPADSPSQYVSIKLTVWLNAQPLTTPRP
ncbi:serine/threonine protein kinase [Yinghuangia sp. KLBMP8922]|uniref:Serine/threonine protein kinase n=1 Tax=Yinghuangia soli TaxID=2908204 RepID=A0AA41PWH0_9ACTN|nr:serine/threonine-protein kinase [Yinghuangia soli]MCF2526134.1 serine/threonine protein kinase [Yinghuangia soli]